MWQTRGLYLLFFITAVQVDQVLCREGMTSKLSGDADELLKSFGNVSSSKDLMKSSIKHRMSVDDSVRRGKHDHTSAVNSTTPKSHSELKNSTSISNSTSAASANSTSGSGSITDSRSLSLNRTRVEHHGIHALTTQAPTAPQSTPSILNSSAHSTVGDHPTIHNVSSSLSGLENSSSTVYPTKTSHSANKHSNGTSLTDSFKNSTKRGSSTPSHHGHSTTQIPNNGSNPSSHGHSTTFPPTTHVHNTSQTMEHEFSNSGINSTRKESSTPSTPVNSTIQIPNNGTHGYNTSIHHSDSTKSPHDRNNTGNPKKDSTRTAKQLKSSPQNSTTKSSNKTSPNSSNVTSTTSPINVTTSTSSHNATATKKLTVTPGMLNGTSHGNSTASANSTAGHNLAATAINLTSSTNSTAATPHHNSTATHGNSKANTTASVPIHISTLLANSTATTTLHNSTLHANSTITPLHCNSTTKSQSNCTANHTQSSPSPASKEPQALKITSDTVFNFMVNHSNTGVPCLLANMSIDLKVSYVKSDQTVSKGNLHVPSAVKSNGTCTGRHAELILMWKEKGKLKVKRATATSNNTLDHGEDNIIIFSFINDGKIAKLDKIQASIFLDAHNFPNSSAKTLRGESESGLRLFTSKVDTTAYVCDNPTDVKAGDIDMTITNIALIAFNSKRDLSSIKVESCQAYTGLNIGAIIGGIILIALIISLGLYLIAWRKKNSYRSSQIP